MGGWFNGGPLWPPHDGGCLAEGGGPPGAVTVKVDTPVPSMAEQSLWEVAVPAGDPLLPAYTLCCRVFLMPPLFPAEAFSEVITTNTPEWVMATTVGEESLEY